MIPKFDVLTQSEVENIHEHSVKILEAVSYTHLTLPTNSRV